MLITQKSYQKALIIHDEGFILFYLYLLAHLKLSPAKHFIK